MEMQLFKDSNDEVWGFPADGSEDSFKPLGLVPITKEEADILRTPKVLMPANEAEAKLMRAAAYRYESDPLFFKFQRDEATKEEWLASIEAIKARFPKVE